MRTSNWSAIKPVPADMVLFRQLQAEGVLLDMRGEEYYGLDEVATRLWTVSMSAPNLDAAVTTLLGEYDVSREVLETDLENLLADLEARGLILMCPSVDGRVA